MQRLPSRTEASVGRALLRFAGWGGAATAALTIAIAAGRTGAGMERARDDLAAMQGGKSQPMTGANVGPAAEKIAGWSAGIEQEMRRQAGLIASQSDRYEGLTDKVSAVERQLSELGLLLARTTSRLESETRSAREAAASAGTAAASAAKLLQAKQEQAKPDPPKIDQPRPDRARPDPVKADLGQADQAKRDEPESSPNVQSKSPGPVSPTGASLSSAAAAALRPTSDASIMTSAAGHGQIPGASGAQSLSAAAAVQAAPAYTGTIPMPAAPADFASSHSSLRPFPAQAATPGAALAPAQIKPQELRGGERNAAPIRHVAEEIALAAVTHGTPFDAWGGSVALSRPPLPVVAAKQCGRSRPSRPRAPVIPVKSADECWHFRVMESTPILRG
jgi:hypothetical protein